DRDRRRHQPAHRPCCRRTAVSGRFAAPGGVRGARLHRCRRRPPRRRGRRRRAHAGAGRRGPAHDRAAARQHGDGGRGEGGVVRVALTGGLATGKSYVTRALTARGIPTIDADALAREAIAPGSAGARAVVDRFGDAVRAPDGAIDRRALARIVFADPDARRDLEAIVHPYVYERIDAWFRAVE